MADALPAPITERDLPGALLIYHAGLPKPPVSILSSSVAQYIEATWRSHVAIMILEQVEEPELAGSVAEMTGHYDHDSGCVDLILNAACLIDLAAAESCLMED